MAEKKIIIFVTSLFGVILGVLWGYRFGFSDYATEQLKIVRLLVFMYQEDPDYWANGLCYEVFKAYIIDFSRYSGHYPSEFLPYLYQREGTLTSFYEEMSGSFNAVKSISEFGELHGIPKEIIEFVDLNYRLILEQNPTLMPPK